MVKQQAQANNKLFYLVWSVLFHKSKKIKILATMWFPWTFKELHTNIKMNFKNELFLLTNIIDSITYFTVIISFSL